MRGFLLAAAVVAVSFSGCMDAPFGGGGNHPPEGELVFEKTDLYIGEMVRYWYYHWDRDGDALTAYVATGAPGSTYNSTGYMDRAALTKEPDNPSTGAVFYNTAGTFRATLRITDGKAWTEYGVWVNVTGPADLPRINHTFHVDTACSLCAEPGVPEQVGGANACLAFRGVGDADCKWMPLTPEHAWLPYNLSSEDADPDMEFRTACTPESESVWLDANDGPEDGTVPEGAGCVIVWAFDDAPAEIVFAVAEPVTAAP